MGENYLTAGAIISIFGLIIAVAKLWVKAKAEIVKSEERMSEHKVFVISELRAINEKTLKNEQSINSVKRDSESCQQKFHQEIAEMKEKRETDFKSLTSTIERYIEKSQGIEEKHHQEVMVKIEKLMIDLTDMRATFEEYRKKE